MRRNRDIAFPDNGFEVWGGYMQAKIAKLEEQFSSRAQHDENQLSIIFNGIGVYVNGYTNPSADEIKTLMSRHGGTYHTYQRRNDFVIASNLPDTKAKKLLSDKIVKPEWITESIAANALLDYRDYLLLNKHTKTQPKLGFSKLAKNNESDICLEHVTKSEIENSMDSGLNRTAHNKTGESSTVSKSNDSIGRTATDPNFLSEFYNNSRLHHISQLGAQFKQHVNELRQNSNFQFPARSHLVPPHGISVAEGIGYNEMCFEGGKVIMHIDMDCFFVSVGLRDRPELRGRAVAVTHSKGAQSRHGKRTGVDVEVEFNLYREKKNKSLSKLTGSGSNVIMKLPNVEKIGNEDDFGSLSEIASCSYEARAKGIKNGMFMGAALRLCPELVAIPYNFEGYKEVAHTLYDTVAQYTLDIEAVSCDEMYVDCTELINSTNVSVQDFATALRNEIRVKTGCPCSAGFGGNRLQARLATKCAKPDGQFFLTSELVQDFMTDIKLSDLPGVGRQTSQRLEALGHETCGSLQAVPLPTLQRLLGHKTGSQLHRYCRGRDDNPLNFRNLRKSVSAEVNYGIRFESQEQCDTFLRQLSAEVCDRMQQFKVKGKSVCLKVMVRAADAPLETAKYLGHGFCDVINRSVNLPIATDDVALITNEVLALYKRLKVEPSELRGVGIQVTKLEETGKQKGMLGKYVYLKTKNCVDSAVVFEGNRSDRKDGDVRLNEVVDKIENENSTTPKKSSGVSTPSIKRSPILENKSPDGKRRRGRPPKHSQMASSSKNALHRFLHKVRTPSSNHYPLEELDQETLSALPEDILEEVLQYYSEHGISIDIKRPQSSTRLSPEPKIKVEEENVASKDLWMASWERVRCAARAWLAEERPQQRDAELLAERAQRMVVDRRLDKLIVILRFLKRKVEELDCTEWTSKYEYIMETVQHAMVAVYGKKLYI